MKQYKPELSNITTKNIGENCTIHSHVWIGDKVEIGNNVKIQAFAFIPNGVSINDDAFIGPHVCFTNDKVPPSDMVIPTIVEKGARIGANATILPGVLIGSGALVGAGAVVTKNVRPNATVIGNPAREVSHDLKIAV
jgi:UDP-2-acetamido-3-amino-2,3-dideoxy-glucuronate N-acetyltransferase